MSTYSLLQAMLKLINSSCRSISLVNENKCSTYVLHKLHFINAQRYSCLSYTKLSIAKRSTLLPLCVIRYQTRLLANISPRKVSFEYFSKNSTNPLPKIKRVLQMSGYNHPEINHASCGGNFETTPEDKHSINDQWTELITGTNKLEATNSRTREIPNNFRIWESVNISEHCEGIGIKFKVVSYNVLSQYLLECHPYLYRDCSPENLKWKVRSALLYDEIVKLAPDILCLQEVQTSHLGSFFSKFEELGYFGVFKQKTGHRHDGCAIYFKQSVFDMEDHISVEFYQPGLPLLNRDNIGIMVKLVPHTLPDVQFVVATTHLLYNPKRTDVRLAQIQVFLAEIDRFSYNGTGITGHLPIILTGDLNSTPESSVVKLLDEGHVSTGYFRENLDWKKIGVTDKCQHLAVYLSRQKGESVTNSSKIKLYNSDYCSGLPECGIDDNDVNQENNELFNSGVIGHSLKLKSVYSNVKPDNQSEVTTYQDYWVTVDYIYFSTHSSLTLVEHLRLPTAEECQILGRLPNNVYGSDHLALGAVFEIKKLKCSL